MSPARGPHLVEQQALGRAARERATAQDDKGPERYKPMFPESKVSC
jgi:hypothetical protein